MTGSLKKSFHTIGGRFKALRHWMGLSQNEFSKRYGIHRQTIAAWELGHHTLTLPSVKKLLEIFNKQGIPVTKEWLMDGTGLSPFTMDTKIIDNEQATGIANFLKEHTFLEIDKAIVTRISDTALSPFYEIDDHIGGLRIDIEPENLKFGHPYIIVLSNEEKIVRLLYKGKEKGLYTLGCFNLVDVPENPVYYNVPIKALYTIVRLWK